MKPYPFTRLAKKLLSLRGLRAILPDAWYLSALYRIALGKKLELVPPRTFNEKLNWLKLHDRNPLYTRLVDKYAVREYVAEKIGPEYLVPLVGGPYRSFDEIDFDALPDAFALKCVHDSGSVALCRDKSSFDKEGAKRKLERALKKNFYWAAREYPYKNVVPRIIAEKFLTDGDADDLKDYKLLCFNGKVRCSFLYSERFTGVGLHMNAYDRDWNPLPFERHYPRSETLVPKPARYETMVALAEKLAQGIPFVRVDFYDVDGRVYFGETTFYPGGGLEEFTPEEWDFTLGSWLELPSPRR